MRQFADVILKDSELYNAVSMGISEKGIICDDIIRCLEDPDENPDVARLIDNIIVQNTPKESMEILEVKASQRILYKLEQACRQVGIILGNPRK